VDRRGQCLQRAAAEAAWRHGAPWLERVLAYVAGNYRFLADFLAAHLRPSGCSPGGTYLAWLDFRPWVFDEELKRRILRQAASGWMKAQVRQRRQGFQRLNLAARGPPSGRRLAGWSGVVLRDCGPPASRYAGTHAHRTLGRLPPARLRQQAAHGVNPYANLAAAVAVIRKQVPAPDLVVLAGPAGDGDHSATRRCWTCSRLQARSTQCSATTTPWPDSARRPAAAGPDFPGYYSST